MSEDNLATVRTFGFRGEALPSIILVARLRMLSRERTVLFSTEVRLESGKVGSLREAGAPVGTTVEFFPQAPARRTFLRSLRREYSYILGRFTRCALAFPQKSSALSFDEREMYAFSPASLPERITACCGNDVRAPLG